MTRDTDKEVAIALLVAARLEQMPLEALRGRLDDEINRRADPPPWLIEASLRDDRQSVLEVLAQVAGGFGEPDARVARIEAVTIATAVLSGAMSPILGARQLAGLRTRAGVPEDDPDFLAFVAIDSEADSLPIGPVRREWAEDALVRKDAEIARAESWAWRTGEGAFRALLQRWGAG